MKRLQDLGEFGLIARIERMAARGHAKTSRAVVLGIGDDAALLRLRPTEDCVATSDAFVENVHFRWTTQSARAIGRTALVANLSDLAAMGARPLGFLLALAAPPTLPVSFFDAALQGMLGLAGETACPLVGGNVTRAQETSFTITALGAVPRGRALKRSSARVGDAIFVSGCLGSAALARARAEAGLGKIRHRTMPRLALGQALCKLPGMGACIDISDGLSADLEHLLEASKVGAQLDSSAIPREKKFERNCAKLGLDPLRLLLAGGEDYELLFTVRGRFATAKLLAHRLGTTVYPIGRIVARGRGACLGRSESPMGWAHF